MALTPIELSHGDIPATDITLPSGTTDVTLNAGNRYFVKDGICYFNLNFTCADTVSHEFPGLFPAGDFGGTNYVYLYPTARLASGDNFSSGELRITTNGAVRFRASVADIAYTIYGCYPVA